MNKRRRVYLPLFIGFVICLLTFFISNAIAMSNISKTANDTIDYAKKQVTSYDEYLDVNKTKSETRLIGKSIEFVDRYHSSSDLSWIEDYLKVQHITGDYDMPARIAGIGLNSEIYDDASYTIEKVTDGNYWKVKSAPTPTPGA